MAATALARLAISARSVAGSSLPGRAMSTLASFGYNRADDDVMEFPRIARGLDYNLNWSLAGDRLTTRGEAYRNASVRDLIEFTPRAGARVTKGRALVVESGAAAATAAYATDVMPGTAVMDVAEAEARANALRSECLSFAPRLFVQDGCVGSTRASELRVRVVSDSPVAALHFRALLHRTPLYDAEVFPRTITVLVGTLAAPDGAARQPIGSSSGAPAGPFTVTDVDPATAKATVLAVGRVSLAALSRAVAAAAAQLQALGGYRHVPGGDSVPNLRAVRAEGLLGWYLRDGHVYAAPGEPHPELVPLQADVVLAAAGGPTLVLGAVNGEVAAAAAAKGRLWAAHHAVWEANGSVASQWAGLSVPEAAAGPAEKLPRGALVTQGRTTLPLPPAPARATSAPSALLLIDPAGKPGPLNAADLVARLSSAGVLGAGQAAPKLAASLAARIAAAGPGLRVEAVASAADAVRVLGL